MLSPVRCRQGLQGRNPAFFVLCLVAWQGLFPRSVGVSLLMMVSTYIKKEFQRDAS